jgi:hypothetical protein
MQMNDWVLFLGSLVGDGLSNQMVPRHLSKILFVSPLQPASSYEKLKSQNLKQATKRKRCLLEPLKSGFLRNELKIEKVT